MTSDKGKVARQQQVGRHAGVRRKFAYIGSSLDGKISAESFPFFQKPFFVRDCIEEITRFVSAVKKFSVRNKFIEHDSAARPLYRYISSCQK